MSNSFFTKFKGMRCAKDNVSTQFGVADCARTSTSVRADTSSRTAFFIRTFVVFALVLCLGLMLSSCASSTNTNNENTGGSNVENANNANSTSTNSNTNDNSKASGTNSNANSNVNASTNTTANKSLVVYFSWSGNTRAVAEEVQKQTNSDMFEIVPVTPYSSDYNETVDYAKEEQQKNARPEFVGSIDNLDDYGTVYVGFPNWWGDMPMILFTFFEKYDLSGKNVALFCTSGGSGLSDTVSEVKNLQPNARVLEGLHVPEADSSSSSTAVSSWLSNIGMK